MTDELAKRLRGWDHCWPAPWLERAVTEAADRIEQLTADHNATLARFADALAREINLTAERDRLREAIDYILDGMGIADPDYDIDPDDDFLDAANSEWVRDTLTRLAAALKGEGYE